MQHRLFYTARSSSMLKLQYSLVIPLIRSWLENGCEMEDDEEDSEYGKVYIVKVPDDKLKFLAETKKLFALPISTGVLYKKINHLPCAIVDDMKEALADTIIKQTSHPDCYEYRNK